MLEYSKFSEFLPNTDLVITGEGKVDGQTASGKTPLGVAQAAKSQDVPTIIIAGSIGNGIEALHEFGIVSIHSIINQPMTLKESITNAAGLLEQSTEQVVRAYFYSNNHNNKANSDTTANGLPVT